MITTRRLFKLASIVVAVPIVLVLLLVASVYLPPVQRWAVERVTAVLEQRMGVAVKVGAVSLTPFLDLTLSDVLAKDRANDTLLDARRLRLDVAFMPLWQGRADIDAVRLETLRLNTKQWLPDVRINGRVGELSAAAHGVAWTAERIRIDRAVLSDADLRVELNDTAQKDTAKTPTRWVIDLAEARLRNTRLRLSLPGDTQHLHAALSEAQLRDGHFDLGRPHYAFRKLSLGGASVAVGTQRPPKPFVALFDVQNLNTQVERLSYNAAGQLRCAVKHFGATEQLRGLTVADLASHIYMDRRRVELPAVRFRTLRSRLDAAVALDWDALKTGRGGAMSVRMDGALDPAEMLAATRGTLSESDLRRWQRMLQLSLGNTPIGVKATAKGNVDELHLEEAKIFLPGMASLTASGRLHSVTSALRAGHFAFSMSASRLDRLEALLPVSARQQVQLPKQIALAGSLNFRANDYRTHFSLGQGGGIVACRAAVNLDTERYEAGATLTRFPIARFLKNQPITPFSGALAVKGRGFTVPAVRSNLVASADIARFGYAAYPLDGLRLEARMAGRDVLIDFRGENPLLRGNGKILAHLDRLYSAEAHLNLSRLDLHRLGAAKDSLTLGADFNGRVSAAPDGSKFLVEGHLGNLRLVMPQRGLMGKNMDFAITASPDTTSAYVRSGDLRLDFSAAGGLERLGRQVSAFSQLAARQFAARKFDQEALKKALPEVSLRLTAGTDNPVAGLLRYMDYRMASMALRIDTDTETGIDGQLSLGKLQTGALRIDTIHGKIMQTAEGVSLNATVHNERRANPHPFTAHLRASLMEHGVGGEVLFADGKGEVGLNLGAKAELEDEGYTFRLYSDNPIVAYRKFAINDDNFVFLGKDKSIRANVKLVADDGTGLQIRSDGGDATKNDISINLKQVNLSELSNAIPYLPKMSGTLSGDFHLIDDHKTISAMGMIDARKFAYEGSQIGDLGGEVVYMPKGENEHYADVFLTFNGAEVAEVSGSYFNVGKGSFTGQARLKRFPLQLLNGFMEDTGFALRGTAEGEFSMSGALSAPTMNGHLDFDKAHLYSNVYGVDFVMDERPLVFRDSRLEFENYQLQSSGGNALTLNGAIDLTQLDAVRLDLSMNARDFALINAQRQGESLVFGKVYSDFSGTIKGTIDRLIVRGGLQILDKTDVTYLLTNSPLSVKDELSDLVKFSDFSDTLVVAPTAEKKGAAMDLALAIDINSGARFHCFLSNNGESYIDVSGAGNLAFRMTQQGEMRMTGRLTFDEGKMNYELPVVPLRTFTLASGSYVEFKGDVMNPTLNISARDKIKAVVTENDRQRAVSFTAGVDITRTLADMGLEFTIEAPDDISLQNRLTTMSTEERGKAAVALLATGMFITDDNLSTGGFKASNALNAFLQSEIQNIAGKALSTIDLSFGLEQGTSASGTATTDYNFQFSKRLLNNRMRIIIGGKVSTGNDVASSTQSFIDNIALEYRIDRPGTCYVHVFYNRDSQDPLEGSLMKTGAGIVVRRKSDTLGELLLFRRKKQDSPNPATKTP